VSTCYWRFKGSLRAREGARGRFKGARGADEGKLSLSWHFKGMCVPLQGHVCQMENKLLHQLMEEEAYADGC
jgi:hypothetical protein